MVAQRVATVMPALAMKTRNDVLQRMDMGWLDVDVVGEGNERPQRWQAQVAGCWKRLLNSANSTSLMPRSFSAQAMGEPPGPPNLRM